MSPSRKTPHGNLLNRTPPQDMETEKALLSAIFILPENLCNIIEELAPSDFYKGAHKKIFGAMLDLFREDSPVDLVTVANRLQEKKELEAIGGAAYLAQISDCAPVAVNAPKYAAIVKDKAKLRNLVELSSTIIDKCLEQQDSCQDITDFAEASIFNVSEQKTQSGLTSVSALINLNVDEIELHHRQGTNPGLHTGYRHLDKLLDGGLQKSDLIILAARPSMGKTAFALNVARNAALGQEPVAVFSLEMSKPQLSMRLLSSETRISSSKLKNGQSLTSSDFTNISDSASIINELPIFIDDTPSITVMEIKAKARRLKKEHGLSLILIDYLQLMRPAEKADRRDLEIAEITRSLKCLAKELEVPVIALSQLNRMLEQRSDKRPMMSDLRESGAIEQDADIISFIYRDEVYNKEPDNPKKNTAEIIVAKNRNGATGTANLLFHGEYTRFEDLAPHYDDADFLG